MNRFVTIEYGIRQAWEVENDHAYMDGGRGLLVVHKWRGRGWQYQVLGFNGNHAVGAGPTIERAMGKAEASARLLGVLPAPPEET